MPKGSIKTCYERATRGLVKSYYLQKLTRANVGRALDDAVSAARERKRRLLLTGSPWVPNSLPLGSVAR
jgi:hypothetical protein